MDPKENRSAWSIPCLCNPKDEQNKAPFNTGSEDTLVAVCQYLGGSKLQQTTNSSPLSRKWNPVRGKQKVFTRTRGEDRITLDT